MYQFFIGLFVIIFSQTAMTNVSSTLSLDKALWVQRTSETISGDYLFFYAEYCPFCERVLPKIKCLGSKVVGVATDKTVEKAKENIKKHSIKFSVYWDQEKEIRNKFGVRGVPALVLVGKEPDQNKVWVGQTDIEDKLKTLGFNQSCD